MKKEDLLADLVIIRCRVEDSSGVHSISKAIPVEEMSSVVWDAHFDEIRQALWEAINVGD